MKRLQRALLLLLLPSMACGSCVRVSRSLDPVILAPAHPKEVQRERRTSLVMPERFSVSPFPPLTVQEASSDWGKEYQIGLYFAADFDLYRALTAFKRALYLLPAEETTRRLEIHYAIALAYFLGHKYTEVIYTTQSTDLCSVNATFVAYGDLLLILYESYLQLNRELQADHILQLIEEKDPYQAEPLALMALMRRADLAAIHQTAACMEVSRPYLEPILCSYEREAKSIDRAQLLNALLPGAGYWYVGLKQTATTAFLVNSLFILAGTCFIKNGNTAAGVITLSLEGGWYFGGITGAGLAAKRYNEALYATYIHKITQKEAYFPILMLKYTF